MPLSALAERVALQVLSKYCRKGNMTRCLRDILPSAQVSSLERDEIAGLMHQVVRWKKLYQFLLNRQGDEVTAASLLALAQSHAEQDRAGLPSEYRYSCSPYVAALFDLHPEWGEYLNSQAPTTLCVNRNLASKEEVMARLSTENLPLQDGHLETAVLSSSSELKKSSVIRERLAFVQDENSQLVAWVVSGLGDRICDYCAGNGGKTLALASISQNGKALFASEVDAARRETMQQRLLDYHASVTVLASLDSLVFEVVLLDAPCSGLGAARRNPEAKYIENAEDFPEIQLSILREASDRVRENGVIVYAVCTITPEETSSVISAFTSVAPFEVIPAPSGFLGYLKEVSGGYLTVVPEGDLFYVSILRRKR